MLTFQVQWSKTRCSFVLFFFLFKNKKKHFKSCSTFFLSTVSSYLKMEYVASQVLFLLISSVHGTSLAVTATEEPCCAHAHSPLYQTSAAAQR